MAVSQISEREIELLEEAVGRVWGLVHLYRRLALGAQNPRVRDVLTRLTREKSEQVKALEDTVEELGGNPGGVSIPREHADVPPREVIPLIFQEEHQLGLWFQAEATAAKSERIKKLFLGLAEQELRHQDIIKDLYRGVTHC